MFQVSAVALALLPASPGRATSQVALSTAVARDLARIAEIEDARGTQGRDLAGIVPFLSNSDPVIRWAAVRALGRQQSPRWLPSIYPLLRDPAESVRLSAMNAVGQAVQGLRGAPSGSTSPDVLSAIDSLARAGAARNSDVEAGVAGRTIGRLPYADSSSARRGEAAIVSLARTRGTLPVSATRLEGLLHGTYALARQLRTLGTPSGAAVALMRTGLTSRTGAPDATARARRLAMLGLVSARAAQASDVRQAQADTDEQVRRLAQVAQPLLADSAVRRAVIAAGRADRSWLVRLEAVRASRAFVGRDGCAPLTEALGDDNPHVMLAAIDGLSSACSDRDRVAGALLGLVDANRSDSPSRAPGRGGWHAHAHALVALARTSPERALPIVRRDARETTFWALRAWVGRAATILRDTVSLRALAADTNGNVRQVALDGLANVTGHEDDARFVAALGATENHVVMDAAQHLKGSRGGDVVVNALIAALERTTATKRENYRDARVALLERIDELGSASLVSRIESYRSDFDTTVARRAAAILAKWTGRTVDASPQPLPLPQEDIATLLQSRWMARLTMAPSTGGGTIEVELFAREAPYTVARFIRLARAGYYNGLTFHRVEPAFVIQGGSPAANEYVGDGPFLRDELSLRSLVRGTLGISTRGRDTGDAQIYVNLTDNFRLDHDYTVFGEIIRGRNVAEGVLEADVIQRVEIVRIP